MMQDAAFAFFDFDNTLCRGDSIVPFLFFAVKRGLTPWWQLLRAAAGYAAQAVCPKKARRSKEIALSFIKGRTQEEMDELARLFFREAIAPRFYPAGVDAIWQAREAGQRVVIVSASAEVYMRVLPEFLPVDAVLSTRCEVEDGRYTGRAGENCKGEEKVRRIEAALAEMGLTVARDASCAYGDSLSDAPMLRLAGKQTLVNPGAALRRALPSAETVRWTTEGGR